MKTFILLTPLLFFIGCGESEPNSSQIKNAPTLPSPYTSDIDFETKLSTENVQFVSEIAELKAVTDKIMTYVGNQELNRAFDEIKKYTILPESEINDVLSATKKQLKLVKNRFGEMIGKEFVYEKQIGKSIYKVVYLAKCKNHPLVWTFIFYKSEKKWTLNNFTWNDDIEILE